jgi:hypothetical protein
LLILARRSSSLLSCLWPLGTGGTVDNRCLSQVGSHPDSADGSNHAR